MMLTKQQLHAAAQPQQRPAPRSIVARPTAAGVVPCSQGPIATYASPAQLVLAPRAQAAGRRSAAIVCQAKQGVDKAAAKEYQITVEKLAGCKRKARVVVPDKLVRKLFKQAVATIERDVLGTMKGFRPGHIPLSIIMQQVGGQRKFNGFCVEEILLDAQKAINQSLGKEPMIPGSLSILTPGRELMDSYQPDKELRFEVAFESAPAISWKKPVTSIEVTIRDNGDFATDAEAVEDLIRQFRKSHGFSRVVAGRGLQHGDTCIMDMEIFSKDTDLVLPGLEQKRFSFDTESDTLGLAQGLLGAKAGETRTFSFKFPEDYSVELWQGMEAKATIKLHELFFWELPEFNDEYVAAHHAEQFSSAKEMREGLMAATAVQRVEALDKELEDAVIKAVAEAVEVDEIPEVMVEQLGERQFQSMLLNMIQGKVGGTEDVEKLATEEVAREFIERRRADLVEQIKFNLAVDDIFTSQGLTLDDAAVNAEADLRKRQMEQIKQEVEEEELMEDVRETVKNVTVIEWLKDNLKRHVLPWNAPEGAEGKGQKQPVAV